MKGEDGMKRKRICLITAMSLIVGLSVLGKTDISAKTAAESSPSAAEAAERTASDSPENESTENESTENESTEATAGCEEMEQVIRAIEGTSSQPSFGIHTEAELNLNGKAIKGSYTLLSEVHISQEENHENLQMSMESSTSASDTVTYAYYKDGWYYTDGADGKKKEEKTADEILEMISGVTDLVKESAAKITTVEVTTDGENTVYRYELPDYLAEDYLEQLLDATGNVALEGAQIHVEEAILETTVDPDGFVKKQTASITGSVHKAIFTIPADASITADFQVPDTEAPEIETW